MYTHLNVYYQKFCRAHMSLAKNPSTGKVVELLDVLPRVPFLLNRCAKYSLLSHNSELLSVFVHDEMDDTLSICD
jgi:hypothetical protein